MDAGPGQARRERRAIALALYTVLAWSTVATAFKLALRHGDVFQLVFFATLVSALTLAGLGAVQGRLRAFLEFSRRDLVGLLNPVAYYLVLLLAYDRLAAQQALALNYTWVLVLAGLSVPFLHQPFSRKLAAALLLGYVGVWIIASGGRLTTFSGIDPAGVALALLSTLIWAGTWILNTRSAGDPLAGLTRQFLLGALVSGVLWLATGAGCSAPAFAGAAYLGVMEMGLSFFTWLLALRLTRQASRVTVLVFLSPVLSLLWIHLILGEPGRISTWTGMGMILAGVALSRRAGPPDVT
ncbi:DMT family transporter [Myxococcota bacterium]|nr:DMT family transporter [Myxococcota bacterium]